MDPLTLKPYTANETNRIPVMLKTSSTSLGFTLIEVLLALSVIAISLTALMNAISSNVSNTQRIKDKSIQHWVGMQAVNMIQLDLLPIGPNQTVTQMTRMLGQQYYWKATIVPTSVGHMEQINIVLSKEQNGPYNQSLIAYRYKK